MVRFMIERVGSRVDVIRDDYHRTPLHDAFWTSEANPTVIDYLLRQPNVAEMLLLKDKRGFTPLDYARREDRTRWIQFLRERKHLLVFGIHSDIVRDKHNDVANEEIATPVSTTPTSHEQHQQHPVVFKTETESQKLKVIG